MKINNKIEKRINAFKKEMIKVLKEPRNEAKKSWLLLNFNHLHDLLVLEVKELFEENKKRAGRCSKKDLAKVMKECLDIANFAFMIYDSLSQSYIHCIDKTSSIKWSRSLQEPNHE